MLIFMNLLYILGFLMLILAAGLTLGLLMWGCLIGFVYIVEHILDKKEDKKS